MAVDAKICGLTRADDAAFAARHGAWRLGVVFAGGPRAVTVEAARAVVAAAAGVPVLGVFGSQPLATILEVLTGAGLSGAQLHGDITDIEAGELRRQRYEVWRVVPVDGESALAADLAYAALEADAIVIEARRPGGSGGLGVPIPLGVAAAARRAAPPVRFVLAGGLTPESVGEAIRVVAPDVVDVSSGVEHTPGVKDHARLARFLEIVRATHAAA
ncbi:MAG: phosphoribosylanthranilate isomerase [Gemmatimonadales bacterium]